MINRKQIIYLVLTLCCFLLPACSGGGGDTAVAPASTDCVLGTSKIGECTI